MHNHSDFSKENDNIISDVTDENVSAVSTEKTEFEIQSESEIKDNLKNDDTEIEYNVEQPKTFREKIKEKVPSMSGKTYRIAVLAFIAFVFFLTAFRVFTIEKSVEFPGFSGEGSFYKLKNTVYTSSFFVLYILGFVLALIISIFSHNVEFRTSKRSNPFIFISSLAGFCMVGCAGFFVYRLSIIDIPTSKLNYLVIILMLCTGAYFAMDAVGFISNKTRPWFTTIVVGFGITRLISEFLNLHDSQYLSSNEYHLVSLTVLLLFFVNNARLHVYENAGIWYRFFGLISALSLMVYALPEIYISLFEPYYIDSVFVFCLVDAVLALYVIAKLLSVKNLKYKAETNAKND